MMNIDNMLIISDLHSTAGYMMKVFIDKNVDSTTTNLIYIFDILMEKLLPL